MQFLSDQNGIVAVEYIILGAISLIVVGASVWQIVGSIANRLNNFNSVL